MQKKNKKETETQPARNVEDSHDRLSVSSCTLSLDHGVFLAARTRLLSPSAPLPSHRRCFYDPRAIGRLRTSWATPDPFAGKEKEKITIERTRSKEEWSDRRGTPRSGNGPRCAPQRRHGGFICSRSHRNKSRGSNPWHVPMFTGTRVRPCVVCSGFYERVEEAGAFRK